MTVSETDVAVVSSSVVFEISFVADVVGLVPFTVVEKGSSGGALEHLSLLELKKLQLKVSIQQLVPMFQTHLNRRRK